MTLREMKTRLALFAVAALLEEREEAMNDAANREARIVARVASISPTMANQIRRNYENA